MAETIQAVRGMNDLLPSETYIWQHVEKVFQSMLQNYGYQEIRFPIVEKTELFKRSIGEVTDIVEKEMYTFLDRNGDSLTLRPEGTACCVRAVMEHGLSHNQTPRLWYAGPYFRHERPQKGRYRQFYQIAAEAFNLPGPDIDAELIVMSAQILEKLGLLPYVTLQINSLGTPNSRAAYRSELVAYLTKHQHLLDEDSLRRLDKNPLRILDTKNPAMKELVANAPKLIEHLDEESAQHFNKMQQYLTQAGVKFVVNPFLVRGLDYYTKTVFEWVTDHLGAQGTVGAGGRYDGLMEQLGGKPTPALGFAFGLERIILLMQETQQAIPVKTPRLYIINDGQDAYGYALALSTRLRKEIPGLALTLHCGGGSLKSQFKKADKSDARYAIIIGEEELKNRVISLKHLREEVPQKMLNEEELLSFLKE